MKEIIIPIIIILILDSIYLYFFLNRWKAMISNIQKDTFQAKTEPIIFIYIILIFSLYYFIIMPKRNVKDAFILGICLYAMFDVLNYALFKNFDIYLAAIDNLWGGVLLATTTYITYKLVKKEKYI